MLQGIVFLNKNWRAGNYARFYDLFIVFFCITIQAEVVRIWSYDYFFMRVSADSFSGDMREVFVDGDYLNVRFIRIKELLYEGEFSGDITSLVHGSRGGGSEPFYKKIVNSCVLERSNSEYFIVGVEEGRIRASVASIERVSGDVFVQSSLPKSVFDNEFIKLFSSGENSGSN